LWDTRDSRLLKFAITVAIPVVFLPSGETEAPLSMCDHRHDQYSNDLSSMTSNNQMNILKLVSCLRKHDFPYSKAYFQIQTHNLPLLSQQILLFGQ
jgi:hypothetical protein